MKYPAIAIAGVLVWAAAVVLWMMEMPSALVVTLFVLGLAAVCAGVILYNNGRIKKAGRTGD